MKTTVSFILGLIVGLAVLQVPAVHQLYGKLMAPQMLIEVESPFGFDETLVKLEHKAKAAGWKVPSKWKVNFQDNLKRVTGIDIGPNQVLKLCEPKAAAQMLINDEFKQLSTMMPCTIAVYEKSNGKTYISLMNMELLGSSYGGDVAKLVKKLAPQMMEMVTLSR